MIRRRTVLFLPALVVGLAATVAIAPTATAHPRPPAPRAATIALPAGLQPEGITSVGSRYYVGSLNDGRIVTGDLRSGGTSQVLLGGATGRQLRGLAYDARTRLLWAVGNVGTVAHVYAVDTRSGRIAADTVVPGGVFLNDLVITPRSVIVTDSGVERLTFVALDRNGRPTGAAPTFVALGGQWPGARGGNSANGIRVLDATHVVLDHSTAGGLWSVDLRTGDAVQIPVTGGPAITGGDGLERSGSTLWVVRGTSNTSVAQLRLSYSDGTYAAHWVRLLTAPSLDVPSTATYTGGTLYAVNARFGVASPATAAYYITRLPV